MINFNPATYWWQWWLDQMNEDGDSEAVPKMSTRLSLSGQIAALESYAQMLEAVNKSGSLETVNKAVQDVVKVMLDAARKQQPASIKSQLSMIHSLIKGLKEEQTRVAKDTKDKTDKKDKKAKKAATETADDE
jgi:hypothetical protein